MNPVSKNEFANNSIWKFMELFSKKIIALILSTILARLLNPDAYGIVALTTVFITFSDIFITNGFNIALIRKNSVNAVDYSTVMVMSLLFSAVLYTIFFLVAPFLANFYETPEFCPVLRVLTLLIFLKSISSVIRARMTRKLMFKKMSLVSVVTSTLASLFGIAFAYNGFGVWALVLQQILANLFDVIALTIVFKWKYSLKVSINAVKEMLTFTIGVIGTSFLDFLGNNINSIVIGKAYRTTDLGYYNRGFIYPETISLNTYNAITSVLLPTLASRQGNPESMKRVVRKVLSVTTYIILPMMFGLMAISDKFVEVVLTDKWMLCVPVLVCGCLYYAINPIRAIGYNVFYAKGESKKCMHIEIMRSIMMILNLLITIIMLKKSIYVLTAVNVVVAFLVAFVTQILLRKSIGYMAKEFISDISPAFIMSCIVVIVVRLITLLPIKAVWILIIQIVAGIVVYLICSICTRNQSFMFLWGYISRILKKGNSKEND